MSEHNVELHRRLIDAYNARDIEAIVALGDPTIEYHSTFEAVGSAVYHGHDGLRKYFRDMEDAWGDDLRLEPAAFFDLREQTLVFQVVHGRGPRSGAEVVMRSAQVARWSEGLVVYWKAYAHREDALRDLGVSEGELEPIDP